MCPCMCNGTLSLFIIGGSCLLDLSKGMVNSVCSLFKKFSGWSNNRAHAVGARGGDRLGTWGSDHTVAEVQQVATKSLQVVKN